MNALTHTAWSLANEVRAWAIFGGWFRAALSGDLMCCRIEFCGRISTAVDAGQSASALLCGRVRGNQLVTHPSPWLGRSGLGRKPRSPRAPGTRGTCDGRQRTAHDFSSVVLAPDWLGRGGRGRTSDSTRAPKARLALSGQERTTRDFWSAAEDPHRLAGAGRRIRPHPSLSLWPLRRRLRQTLAVISRTCPVQHTREAEREAPRGFSRQPQSSLYLTTQRAAPGFWEIVGRRRPRHQPPACELHDIGIGRGLGLGPVAAQVSTDELRRWLMSFVVGRRSSPLINHYFNYHCHYHCYYHCNQACSHQSNHPHGQLPRSLRPSGAETCAIHCLRFLSGGDFRSSAAAPDTSCGAMPSTVTEHCSPASCTRPAATCSARSGRPPSVPAATRATFCVPLLRYVWRLPHQGTVSAFARCQNCLAPVFRQRCAGPLRTQRAAARGNPTSELLRRWRLRLHRVAGSGLARRLTGRDAPGIAPADEGSRSRRSRSSAASTANLPGGRWLTPSSNYRARRLFHSLLSSDPQARGGAMARGPRRVVHPCRCVRRPTPAETRAPVAPRDDFPARPRMLRDRRFVRGGTPGSSAPAGRRLPSAATLRSRRAIPSSGWRSDSGVPVQRPPARLATMSPGIQAAADRPACQILLGPYGPKTTGRARARAEPRNARFASEETLALLLLFYRLRGTSKNVARRRPAANVRGGTLSPRICAAMVRG